MAKIEVDITKKILERREVPVRQRNEILQDIKHVLEQEALEKEMKPPTEKKEFVILISDPKGVLNAAYPDGVVGWVLQIPEGDGPHLALDKLTAAAYEHNASPKGRKFPVETIGEACESVSPKILKEHKVWVKTKIPVLAITTNNILPKAPDLPD
jgi:hypothetical protein